jgi:hypothetical protein
MGPSGSGSGLGALEGHIEMSWYAGGFAGR